MNLFTLSSQYQSLMAKIMDSEEISDELMKSLEQVNDSLENKILNYTSMVKSLRAKQESIVKAMEGMKERVDRLEKSASWFENSIKNEMVSCDKTTIENEYHEVRLFVNNPRVAWNDKNIVPKEFWRHKIKEIFEPDTSMINKALKDGIEVPGAYLVRDTRLSIR